MSWRLMKLSAVTLWLLSGLSVVMAVVSGMWGMSLALPLFCAGGTATAGLLFWRMGAEQQKVLAVITEALQGDGMPMELVEGLTHGQLSEEQFNQLCEWTEKQVDA